MNIYVDIDGTICQTTGLDYGDAIPIPERIKRVNELYRDGNTIIYYTARGTKTGIDYSDLSRQQLEEWGCQYHKLKLGKPAFDLLIDDKAVNSEAFFNKREAGGELVLRPIHGTRDVFPESYQFREYLFDIFRSVSRLFTFEGYDVNPLERTALWRRKAGEDVVKQLFNFTYTDDGVTHEVCLRPEITPSLARMIMQCKKSLPLPVRWYTIAQCWRNESVQVGRKREHYQWNADIIGVKGVGAEAELITLAVQALRSLGLLPGQIVVRISDRRILEATAVAAGVPAELFNRLCIEIDRLDKVGRASVTDALSQPPLGLSQATASAILNVASTTSIDAARLAIDAVAVDVDSRRIDTLCREFQRDLSNLWELLEDTGVATWCRFDASIVRGLGYYTGTVFEIFDCLGPDKTPMFRAIAGGGRYDKLLEMYGCTDPTPAAGFGFGDCVIEEVLKVAKLTPNFKSVISVMVIPFARDPAMIRRATIVTTALRRAGITTDLVTDAHRTAKWAFAYAARRSAVLAVYVAPDEAIRGAVQVKMLWQESKGIEIQLGENCQELVDFIQPLLPVDNYHLINPNVVRT